MTRSHLPLQIPETERGKEGIQHRRRWKFLRSPSPPPFYSARDVEEARGGGGRAGRERDAAGVSSGSQQVA